MIAVKAYYDSCICQATGTFLGFPLTKSQLSVLLTAPISDDDASLIRMNELVRTNLSHGPVIREANQWLTQCVNGFLNTSEDVIIRKTTADSMNIFEGAETTVNLSQQRIEENIQPAFTFNNVRHVYETIQPMAWRLARCIKNEQDMQQLEDVVCSLELKAIISKSSDVHY